jgi:hypothetical protein
MMSRSKPQPSDQAAGIPSTPEPAQPLPVPGVPPEPEPSAPPGEPLPPRLGDPVRRQGLPLCDLPPPRAPAGNGPSPEHIPLEIEPLSGPTEASEETPWPIEPEIVQQKHAADLGF